MVIRGSVGVVQVAEQLLNALGIQTCADVMRMRGSLSALFSEITTDFTLSAALGLGGTSHHPPAREGQVSRKGMGVERTFTVISQPKDLEAKVLLDVLFGLATMFLCDRHACQLL